MISKATIAALIDKRRIFSRGNPCGTDSVDLTIERPISKRPADCGLPWLIPVPLPCA